MIVKIRITVLTEEWYSGAHKYFIH